MMGKADLELVNLMHGMIDCDAARRDLRQAASILLGLVVLLFLVPVAPAWADSGSAMTRDQAVELCKTAYSDWVDGNAQEALAKYKAAELVFQARVKDHPDDPQAQRDISVLSERLGDVYVRMDNGAKALSAYRKSLEIDERLLAADPGNAWQLQHLAMVSLKTGDLYVWLAKAENAEAMFERSVGYCEKLSALDNGHTDALVCLCQVRHRQVWLLQRLGLADEAAQARQMELAVREELYSGSAKDKEALFYAYKHLGEQYRQVGQWPDSVETFQESIGLAERLIHDFPENIQYKWELSSVFRNLGELHAQQDEWDAAFSAYQQVLLLGRHMVEIDAENRASHQRDVMVTHYKLGKILEVKEESEAALQEYKAALVIAETLGPDDAGDRQRDVAEIKKEIARLEH